MLKKMSIRKIMVTSLALFALVLLYLMPDNRVTEYAISNSDIEYVYTNTVETIYLLDSNDYVARTTMNGCDCDTKESVKDVIEGLIIGGAKSNKIPNGFRTIIPTGTEVLGLELKEKVLTVNFSQELLDINIEYEDKMIEAIVYTLTSVDGIDKVIIQVEGEVLERLPNSGKILPSVFDRTYGINKTYDLSNTMNIDSYTIYYVSSYNDYEYYVPVTKYVNNNNNKDRVKVIIDELSSSPIYENNLMSYLNSNTSLIDYTLENDILKLNFDDSIYKDNSNTILEEVVYTISLSFLDNYDVKEVVFLVNNEEIYKNDANF